MLNPFKLRIYKQGNINKEIEDNVMTTYRGKCLKMSNFLYL